MESTFFLIVLGVLSVAVLVKRKAASAHEGARGERAVDGILRQSLHSADYAVLRDVVLETELGTVRIEHLVVSCFGIFVIAARHFDGEIFGSEWDSHWIRSCGDSRVEFANPLHENHVQIAALQTLLGLRKTRFHSAVVFTGKAEFRNPMPVNVMQLERLVAFIEVRNAAVLSEEEARRVARVIESRRLGDDEAAAVAPSELPSLRPGPVAEIPRRARSNGWPAIGGRLAVRALAGVSSIAVVLLAGYALLGGPDGLEPVGGSWPTANYPYPTHPPLVAAPGETDEAPAVPEELALQCSYSAASRRCVCQDPEGAKVPVGLEQCLALAGGDPR